MALVAIIAGVNSAETMEVFAETPPAARAWRSILRHNPFLTTSRIPSAAACSFGSKPTEHARSGDS